MPAVLVSPKNLNGYSALQTAGTVDELREATRAVVDGLLSGLDRLSGSLTLTGGGSGGGGVITADHGALTGRGDDDHTQYALLAGRSSGQTLIGGTASGDGLTLESTSNAAKGEIIIADGTNLALSANEKLIFDGTGGDTNISYVSASTLVRVTVDNTVSVEISRGRSRAAIRTSSRPSKPPLAPQRSQSKPS